MSGVNGNGSTKLMPQHAKLPWYPRDFASSTRGWPVTARGVYRELLDAEWDLGSLPESPRELQMLAGATANEWKRSWPLIAPKFPVGDDSRRRNARLEYHRQKALHTAEQQRKAAEQTNRALGRGAR